MRSALPIRSGIPERSTGGRQAVRAITEERGPSEVLINWHGHSDRGLAVINSLAAGAAGADVLHAAGLGIGERSGNTPMDQLLVNLKLMGYWDHDLEDSPAMWSGR